MGKRRAVAAGCAGLVKRGAFGAGQVFEARAECSACLARCGCLGQRRSAVQARRRCVFFVDAWKALLRQGQAQAGCAWQHINL